ncbi:kinase-like domain-containing protein, partial [Achaetomium macrosporum]
DQLHFPPGFGFKDCIGDGNSGIIPLDKDTLTVIKIPSGEEHSEEINIERRIYERFVERGGHKAIPIYHGASEHGIRLGHVHHGNVRSYLDENAADEKTRMRCAVEVAEALDFTHECGVIHGDVQGFNVLVDWRLDAKLADFAGSSFDGSPLLIATYENYEYPGPKLSHKADIFSLGSTIYELMTDSPPYAGLSEKMILSRYSKGEFPDTESLGTVGSLITKCWRVEYEECKQVVHDLKGERFLFWSLELRATDTSKSREKCHSHTFLLR